MTILILKSSDDQIDISEEDKYVKILNASGFESMLVETLSFSLVPNDIIDFNCWKDNFSSVLFTSQRAVWACQNTGLLGDCSDICFAVGPATAKFARKLGFKPIGENCGNASVLADLIAANYKSTFLKPVLFLTGEKHGKILPTKLRENGIAVFEHVVYSARCNPALCSMLQDILSTSCSPPIACIVFFSPSAVEATASVIKSHLEQKEIKIVSIGLTTSEKIKSMGLPLSGVSPTPTPEGLLSFIKSLYTQSTEIPTS